MNASLHCEVLSSSTNESNLGDIPEQVLWSWLMSLVLTLWTSAARSRSCLTVSLVTIAPLMVFWSWGRASSRCWAVGEGAIWDRRKKIIWQMTLISSESSERPGMIRLINWWRSSFVKQVSSYERDKGSLIGCLRCLQECTRSHMQSFLYQDHHQPCASMDPFARYGQGQGWPLLPCTSSTTVQEELHIWGGALCARQNSWQKVPGGEQSRCKSSHFHIGMGCILTRSSSCISAKKSIINGASKLS